MSGSVWRNGAVAITNHPLLRNAKSVGSRLTRGDGALAGFLYATASLSSGGRPCLSSPAWKGFVGKWPICLDNKSAAGELAFLTTIM